MYPKQIEPTSYESKTETELIRVGTPVVGDLEVRDTPKFEVEAAGKVEGSITYGTVSSSFSITASGKGKFGIRVHGRTKTTEQWFVDVTYRQSTKVMGQKFGGALYNPITETGIILFEGYIDWLEPDIIGNWEEVSRSDEYLGAPKVEFIVDHIELYDPPVVPQFGGLPLRLAEGKFTPMVDSFDGQQITISVAGSAPDSMTVSGHTIKLDGVQLDPNLELPIGQGALSLGAHDITIEAYGDAGFFEFHIPAEVVPPVEIEAPTGKQSVNFDGREVFQVRLRNNTSLVQRTQVSARATSDGWIVDAPINAIPIEPHKAIDVPISVYGHPFSDSDISTEISVAAVPDQGTRVETSFTVSAHISIASVRQVEIEAVRQLHALQELVSSSVSPSTTTTTTTTTSGNTTTTITTTSHSSALFGSQSGKILLNVCDWVTIRDENIATSVRIKFNSRLDNDIKIEIRYDGRDSELDNPGDETVVYAKKIEVHAEGTVGSIAEIEVS
jgi:hypothetical protein